MSLLQRSLNTDSIILALVGGQGLFVRNWHLHRLWTENQKRNAKMNGSVAWEKSQWQKFPSTRFAAFFHHFQTEPFPMKPKLGRYPHPVLQNHFILFGDLHFCGFSAIVICHYTGCTSRVPCCRNSWKFHAAEHHVAEKICVMCRFNQTITKLISCHWNHQIPCSSMAVTKPASERWSLWLKCASAVAEVSLVLHIRFFCPPW